MDNVSRVFNVMNKELFPDNRQQPLGQSAGGHNDPLPQLQQVNNKDNDTDNNSDVADNDNTADDDDTTDENDATDDDTTDEGDSAEDSSDNNDTEDNVRDSSRLFIPIPLLTTFIT